MLMPERVRGGGNALKRIIPENMFSEARRIEGAVMGMQGSVP